MAGIVVSIGEGSDENFEQCVTKFRSLKGLTISHQEKTNTTRIAKFSYTDREDDNLLSLGNKLYMVVGTMIYGDTIGKKALALLDRDMQSIDIEKATKGMDGPFCLMVLDRASGGLSIVTDHAGILNIYRYSRGTHLYISSSSMTLSRTLPVTVKSEGVVQFLRNASICDSDTIYDEIKVLEPASIYRYPSTNKNGNEIKSTYWSSPTKIDETLSYSAAKEKLKYALFNSLKWIQGKKVVCDATGGYDSRTIMANLLKYRKESNLSLEGFVYGPPESKEVKMVKNYQAQMNLTIHHLALPDNWPQVYKEYIENSLNITDGEESAFYYAPILYAHKFKQSRYDIALNGLGGELYRDFWWIQEIIFNKKKADYLKLIKNRVLQYEYDYSIFSEQWKKRMQDIANIYARRYLRTNSDMNLDETFNTLQIDNIYFRQKIRRWAGRTISSSNQMIRSLAPLTFKKNIDIGMIIPPKFKLFGRIIRDVINDLDPPLANLPMLNGAPCVPLNIENMVKFGSMAIEYQKKLARKIFQKYFKKTILLDPSISYNQNEWINGLFDTRFLSDYLDIDNMKTKELYEEGAFRKFVDSAKIPGFPYMSQLGNIATLEMRMREDMVKGV